MPPFSVTITGDSPNELRENTRRFLATIVSAEAETAEPAGKRGKKGADVQPAPAAAPTAPTAPAAAPAGVTQAEARKILQAVVAKLGRDKCSEICIKHGAPNLGAIKAENLPALVKDAQAALAAADADPTA